MAKKAKAKKKAPKAAAKKSATHDLAAALLGGRVKVIDLTAILGPETPLIKLPPSIGLNTPQIEIHTISHYDDKGPYWAWNWLKIGEHSGTHFDAPQHWITGKDYKDGATDTIPAKNFVAPVNVIDCSKEVKKNPDFLLTVDHVKAWEAKHGAIEKGSWVVLRSDWYKKNGSEATFLNASLLPVVDILDIFNLSLFSWVIIPIFKG